MVDRQDYHQSMKAWRKSDIDKFDNIIWPSQIHYLTSIHLNVCAIEVKGFYLINFKLENFKSEPDEQVLDKVFYKKRRTCTLMQQIRKFIIYSKWHVGTSNVHYSI